MMMMMMIHPVQVRRKTQIPLTAIYCGFDVQCFTRRNPTYISRTDGRTDRRKC